MELFALPLVEGAEEVVLGGRDGAFGAAEQSLAALPEAHHVAPAVDLVAGALDEPARGEVRRDDGEVAPVDPERIGELGLTRLTEHLELLEDEELLGPEAERPHRAPDASGGVAAEPSQERRHRHLVGRRRGGAHGTRLGDLLGVYHNGRLQQ